MHPVAGIGLIATGVGTTLVVVFRLWKRLVAGVAFALLAASGVAVGAGALLVQEHAGVGEWAITLFALGGLTPLHMRLVFGRPGGRVVAEVPPAA